MWFAAGQNMEFLDKDEMGTIAYLKSFKLFADGRGSISNLCQKKSGILDETTYLFDYTYTVSTGKTHITYEQTVFFVNSKKLGLPEFILKPERFLNRIAAFLGWDDINFEMYPEFSNKYYLKGEDEHYIRYHFDDKVLRFFSNNQGWSVEAVNYFLIFYSHNVIIPAENIATFYNIGLGIYELFARNNSLLESEEGSE